MDSTTKLTSFVIFILIGSTVFSLVFRLMDGDRWVEGLLTALPGGELGFLIVVNLLVFLLAFFLDFFEIAFIIVPLLAPVAAEAGHRSDLVRRPAGHQHADLVHASAVRLRSVLSAQRRA
jgi:TRAP-type mannitol/chloroaromatic compound transport system permease large subunit